MNATGPTGARVTYSTSATDLVDGRVPVTCSRTSGTLFAIGTTTVSCSAVDVRRNRANGSFTVTVKGAATQIGDLIGLVNSLGLSRGVTANLVSKLQAALDSINSGKSGACTKLAGFVTATIPQTGRALRRRKRLN